MNRFSSIDNINRKYRNSQVGATINVGGGFPSSYHPPSGTIIHGAGAHNTVIRPTGLRNSYVAGTVVNPSFAPGTQVIRVEEPPQVIYHQPANPGRVVTTTHQAAGPGIHPSAIPVPAINTSAPIDVPVVSRPINQGRPPLRRSIVGGAKSSGCPWYCWLIFGLLALLLLAGVLFGLWTYFVKNKEGENKREIQVKNKGEATVAPVATDEEKRKAEEEELARKASQDQKNKQPQNPESNRKTEEQKKPEEQPAPQNVQNKDKPEVTPAPQTTQKPKQQTPKVDETNEQPKPEQPAAPQTKQDANKVPQQPKAEEPKAEQPKAEQPKEQNTDLKVNSTEQSALPKNTSSSETKVTKITCQDGFFFYNGRCLACPKGSEWNGTNCIRKKPVTTLVSTQSDKTEIGAVENESQLASKGAGQKQSKDQSSSKHYLFEDAASDVPDGFSQVPSNDAGGLARRAWRGTRNAASNAWQGAKDFGRQAEASSPAVAGVASGLRTIGDGTTTVARSAWQGAKDLGRRAENSPSPAISGIASGLRTVGDATRNVASSAWQGTKSLGRSIFGPQHMRRYN